MIHCPNCGFGNEPKCSKCAEELVKTEPERDLRELKIENYQGMALLAMFFFPFIGIFSVYNSMQVNTKLFNKDVDGAVAASNKANLWAKITFYVVIILIILRVWYRK